MGLRLYKRYQMKMIGTHYYEVFPKCELTFEEHLMLGHSGALDPRSLG